jgi:predicted Zn-dependent protease
MTLRRPAAAALLALAAAACSASEAPSADPAIALFERRTAADPRDHLSATILAELCQRRAAASGDAALYVRSERAARTALERQPGHPAAIVALARALLGLGRASEARRLVSDLLDTQPRHVGALETSFDIAFAANDLRTARQFADRLLAVNEEPGTLRRLAQLAERDGDPARAASLYDRAAENAMALGAMQDEIDDYRRREAAVLSRTKEGTR